MNRRRQVARWGAGAAAAGLAAIAIGAAAPPAAVATPEEDCQAVRDRDHQIWLDLIANLPPGSPIPPEPINPCIPAGPETTTTAPAPLPGQGGQTGTGGSGPQVGANAPTLMPRYNGTDIVPVPGLPAPPSPGGGQPARVEDGRVTVPTTGAPSPTATQTPTPEQSASPTPAPPVLDSQLGRTPPQVQQESTHADEPASGGNPHALLLLTGLAGAVAGATRFGRGTRAAAADPTGLMGRTPESFLAQAVGMAVAPVMQYVPGGTERLVVREGEGFRTLFLINDKSSLHEAVIETPPVPDGGSIRVNANGTASIVDADGYEVSRMAAPWAYDANGRPVPTRYVVRGGQLVQQVYADADTAYPILADPNDEGRKGPGNANKENKSGWKTDQDTAGGQFLSGNQVDQVRQNAQNTSNTASGVGELMGQAQNATPTSSLAETGTGSPAADVVYANQIDQPVTSNYGGGTTATMYPTGHESGVAASYRTGPDSNGAFEEGTIHEEGGQSRSRLTPVPGYPDSYDIVTENPDHTVTIGRRTPDGQGGYTLWTSNPDGSHTMFRDGVSYTVPAGMDPTQAAPVVSRIGTDGVIYTRSQNVDGTVSEAVSHPMPGGRVMAFITNPDDTVSVAISGPIDENGRNDTTIQHPNGNATLITKDDRFIGLDPDGRPTDLFDENYQMGTRWNPWTDQWEPIPKPDSPEREALTPNQDFGDGVGDAIVDMVKGIAPLIGLGGRGAPGVVASWRAGPGTLVGLGGEGAPGVADSWKNFGKNLIAWDEFASGDYDYATGKALLNIGTALVGPKGITGGLRGAAESAVGAAGRGAAESAVGTAVRAGDEVATAPPVLTPPKPSTGMGAYPNAHRIDREAAPLFPPNAKPYGKYTPDEWQAEFVDPATGYFNYPEHTGLALDAARNPVYEVLEQFPPGARFDRFGDEGGKFLGTDGDPFPMRSLPPKSASDGYFRYVQDKPLPPNRAIVTGKIAEAFGADGGGIQFQVIKIDPVTGLPDLIPGMTEFIPENFVALRIREMIGEEIIKRIYPPT